MKIAILDYGAGNLHSLAKAVAGTDCTVTIEADAAKTLDHDALILPGVGAFGLAATSIAPHVERLRDALSDGFPCLGICLGMQLLFDESEEGDGRGIGIIPGRVRRLRAAHVPQIGWNDIEERRDDFYDDSRLSSAYFANSFVCEPDDMSTVTAWTTHESDRFAASVKSGSVVGVQFHPEKSSHPGVAFIHAFLQALRQ
jgi:imidazole glycerol-phosphate synthase subunit HisH